MTKAKTKLFQTSSCPILTDPFVDVMEGGGKTFLRIREQRDAGHPGIPVLIVEKSLVDRLIKQLTNAKPIPDGVSYNIDEDGLVVLVQAEDKPENTNAD